MSNETNENNPTNRPPVVIEVKPDAPHQAREAASGREVHRPTVYEQAQIATEEFAKMAEENGRMDIVAKLRGEKYNPTGMDIVKSSAKKVQSALTTVAWALLPGGILVLLWEGIRFAIPAARTWPGFVKYDARTGGAVRLQTPKP